MGVSIGSHHLEKWKNRYEGALKKAQNAKAKMHEVADTGISAAATAGTAFALGVVDGQTGGVDVKGVPLPLIVGVGAHAIAFFTGKEALHDVGNGGIAAFAYSAGRSIGIDRAKAHGSTKVKGDDRGSARLTAEELASIANA